jgi:hypothetical protein
MEIMKTLLFNNKKNISIVLLAISLTGCSSIMKAMYGIKKPKVENEASIMKWLKKDGMTSENVVALSYSGFKSTLTAIKNKMPEVFIFNENGEYIPYGDEWACNAHAFNFIESLNDTTNYVTGDKMKLDDEITLMRNLKGETLNSPIKTAETDFYVLIFCAKYAGKLNKNHAEVWEQQALNNKNAQIKVVKVDMDLQEFWGDSLTQIHTN